MAERDAIWKDIKRAGMGRDPWLRMPANVMAENGAHNPSPMETSAAGQFTEVSSNSPWRILCQADRVVLSVRIPVPIFLRALERLP